MQECSVSDLFTKTPKALLESLNDLNVEDALIWMHLPLNHTAWINPCLQNVVSTRHSNQALLIMEQKYWQLQERKRKDIAHSRYFEPSCFQNSGAGQLQFVIYLPYLHWDSSEGFAHRARYSDKTKGGANVDIPETLSEDEKAVYKVIREDRDTSSLHPRRSLDQYFYSGLPDTTSRDKDQVISKYKPKDGRGGEKMIMVDQLWLWLFESADPGSDRVRTSIFTSFPRKERRSIGDDRDLEDVADLRQAIIDEANSRDDKWASNKANYAGLIIEQAVNVMLRVRTEESLDFLSIFRAAIGQATESQTKFFRDFQEELRKGSKNISDPDTKREEVKLALELSDIMDELNSINRLFEAQIDVLEAAENMFSALKGRGGQVEGYRQLRVTMASTKVDVEGYMKQVKRMTADAQRTQDSLKDLLDLQQKEETLNEAHYSNEQADAAREQADATEAQSQILILFTIVTIVFAPLSFFTSYYGMNVREFTGEQGNTNQGEVWKVMGQISAFIIIGLLSGAWYLYRDTQRQQRARRKARRNVGTNGT
ncbi:hypothetical protein IQ06DRAFT_63520 [Phaeosphaeriaceae sp. SRC1lsM3a]|nr:hypothetical protein IQ06DRAFT_63520 [Stagonospora sp. SRC1lsM3a]